MIKNGDKKFNNVLQLKMKPTTILGQYQTKEKLMRSILFFCFAALSLSAFASSEPEYNQKKLNTLLDHKIGTIWTCSKNHNPDAVIMFNVSHDVGGMIGGTTPLAIQDQQICDALKVTCPFIANAYEYGRSFFPNSKFVYWATNGKYEDTLAFFSEEAGMKLVLVSNGSQASIEWDNNYFFNERECIESDQNI